ncbi:MAG TPA: sigma-70 family RNA polymerase sigma factor [Planctomycetes bacterium]|nr:sigma-70 family RNA polymerase sigma factor [Planctomycetota bacterium]
MEDKSSYSSRPGDDIKTEGFLHLLTANNKRIYAFIFTLVPNYFDADDIMQETVTFMYRNFKDFEPGTDFFAWAMRIAHYRVLSFLQKQKGRRIKFDNELIELIQSDAVPILSNMTIRLETLRVCLKKLIEQDRKLLRMRYEQGITVKDIANHINKSTHSVYRYIARIHDTLLRCIRRTLAEEVA